MLTDGAALYTPGLSENRGGASRYYSNDLLGNLWTIDGSAKSQAYYQDATGFGTPMAQAGSGSVFGYGGGNGCQTDADTGLILMGHRYYDTRIGRFISQDPIGDGDNWYAYADNSPTNEIDPAGLAPEDGLGSSPMGSPGYSNIAAAASAGAYYNNEVLTQYTVTHNWQEMYKFSADSNGGGSYKDTGEEVEDSDTYSIGINPLLDPLAEGADVPTFLYRGGGRNPSALTPRPGADTQGPKRGLSAFDSVEKAARPGQPYQTISTDDLTSLNVVQTGEPGHYSIRPDTQTELDEWAATKGTSTVSPYTTEVKNALVGSPGIAPDGPCPICP